MFGETFRVSFLSAALGFIGLSLAAIDGLAHAANLQGNIRPDEPSPPPIAIAQRNLVAIRVGRAYGTGFYIDDRGHLLTSAHVIGMALSVTVTLPGGRTVPGQVIAVDPVRDVALIWTRPVGVLGLPLRADTPATGSVVHVLGSRSKHDALATVSHGVLRVERIKNGQRLLHSNADISPGHSGGPLLDDRGHVIGVTVSGVFFKGSGSDLVPLGISFFVPISEALEALGTHLRGFSSFVLVGRVAGPPITAPTATH